MGCTVTPDKRNPRTRLVFADVECEGSPVGFEGVTDVDQSIGCRTERKCSASRVAA
jgi:hypothetical protein